MVRLVAVAHGSAAVIVHPLPSHARSSVASQTLSVLHAVDDILFCHTSPSAALLLAHEQRSNHGHEHGLVTSGQGGFVQSLWLRIFVLHCFNPMAGVLWATGPRRHSRAGTNRCGNSACIRVSSSHLPLYFV